MDTAATATQDRSRSTFVRRVPREGGAGGMEAGAY